MLSRNRRALATQLGSVAALGLAFGIVALVAGCGVGGGVTSEEKPDLLGDGGRAGVAVGAQPVKMAVMPVAVSLASDGADANAVAAAKSQAYLDGLWRQVTSMAERSPAFQRVPLPQGAEADEIIVKTMHAAAGILPVGEFKKVKGFQLPEHFLYGHVNVMVDVNEAIGKADTKAYHADALLRLVNGKTFDVKPSMGRAKAASFEQAVADALQKAVDGYQVR